MSKNKKNQQIKKHIQQSKKKPAFSHDRFFKIFYSDPKLSKELLEIIFSKEELEAYDLNKLKTEKDTFEDKRADLILSFPFKAYPKIKLRVFILLEHKSSYDKNFFDQLLDYQGLLRKFLIQQTGQAQLIIPVLFYHGKEPFKWKKSLQEEDFKTFFSKIPLESRKSMLNYEPKVVNTKDPKIQKAYRGKEFKSHGVIKLLTEIWSLKKNITPLKIVEIFSEFEELLKRLNEQARKTTELRIIEYLKDNTNLNLKIWKQAEERLIEKGLLTQGGLMQDVREIIKEKGVWEGMRKGLRKGRKEGIEEGRKEGIEEGIEKGIRKGQKTVILNMLKEKVDIPFIAKITGFSESEIKKLKNNS